MFDPDSNIEQQRQIAAGIAGVDSIMDLDPEEIYRLAELVIALDGWLCSGGALPRTWRGAK